VVVTEPLSVGPGGGVGAGAGVGAGGGVAGGVGVVEDPPHETANNAAAIMTCFIERLAERCSTECLDGRKR